MPVTLAHLPLLLDAGPDVELPLAGVVRKAQAGPPRIRRLSTESLPEGAWPATGQPDDLVFPVRAEHYRIEDDGTLSFVADLTDSFDRDCLDVANEAGSGSISFVNDDPALAALQVADLVRFVLYGDIVFVLVVDELEAVEVTDREEVAEITTASGRGQNSLLEQARVYPAGGVGRTPVETDRLFAWQAFGYDDSGWANAVPIGTVAATSAAYPVQPVFQDWPSDGTDASVIWGVAQSLPGPDVVSGRSIFRSPTASVPADGQYIVIAAMDDFGTLWVDGVELQEFRLGHNNFERVTMIPITLSAGEHVFAAETVSAFWPGLAGGLTQDVAAFAMDLYTALNGEPGTQVPGFATDADWKTVAYPSVDPGVTPGSAILTCLEEAQARGALLGIVPTFTAEVDSAGAPWPVVGEISTKTGTDLLTFLRELSATYIDFAVAAGDLSLSVWRKGGRGRTGGVTLAQAPADDPNTGNITRLTRRRV